MHGAPYRTYFADNINVDDLEELLKINTAVDLNVGCARHILQSHNFSDAVNVGKAPSRRFGVNEMPTFVASQRGAVGLQPHEFLERLVKDASTKRRD